MNKLETIRKYLSLVSTYRLSFWVKENGKDAKSIFLDGGAKPGHSECARLHFHRVDSNIIAGTAHGLQSVA
jgi:hypothetical protein